MKNDFEFFDSIVEKIGNMMPKTICLVKNEKRYNEIVKAVGDIQEFIKDIDDEATFKVAPDELLGTSIVLEVICNLLSTTEMDKFCNAISKADSIDIEPRTDGLMNVVFGFENAFKPAPPYKE